MMLSIKERMNLEEVCGIFFGNRELAKCVKGEYTPKDYIWQSTFRVKKHGTFLAFLLFNGVFDRESERYVVDFVLRYKGRIFGSDVSIRKCIVDRVQELGFEYGMIQVILASLSSKQLYIAKEPVCCLPMVKSTFPNLEIGKHISLRCAYIQTYFNLYQRLNPEQYVIEFSSLTPKQILLTILSNDVYDHIVTFEDRVVISAMLRVCLSQWKTAFVIRALRDKLASELDSPNLRPYRRRILDKYDECAKLVSEHIETFKEQSPEKCKELYELLVK